MAIYTIQLRDIVESGIDIFDFEYPLYDPNYKKVLEQKIINHYYFREIGLETIAQFKHFLKEKMNRIMPLYTRYYETEFLITKDDYMINLDNTITRTNEVKSNSSGNAKGKGIFSDTPQAKLQGGLDYATNMNEDTSSTTGQANTFETYIEKLRGNASMRYNADILDEWRKTWHNIDEEIIEELNDLFMNIY